MDEIFEDLLAQGFRLLTEGAKKVLICKTSDGECHCQPVFASDKEKQQEEILLSEISGKQVTHILVLLENTTLDVPTPRFRQQLLSRCPGSQDAFILLQTGSQPIPLPLSMLP